MPLSDAAWMVLLYALIPVKLESKPYCESPLCEDLYIPCARPHLLGALSGGFLFTACGLDAEAAHVSISSIPKMCGLRTTVEPH